jgi:hypothetical protein
MIFARINTDDATNVQLLSFNRSCSGVSGAGLSPMSLKYIPAPVSLMGVKASHNLDSPVRTIIGIRRCEQANTYVDSSLHHGNSRGNQYEDEVFPLFPHKEILSTRTTEAIPTHIKTDGALRWLGTKQKINDDRHEHRCYGQQGCVPKLRPAVAFLGIVCRVPHGKNLNLGFCQIRSDSFDHLKCADCPKYENKWYQREDEKCPH